MKIKYRQIKIADKIITITERDPEVDTILEGDQYKIVVKTQIHIHRTQGTTT